MRGLYLTCQSWIVNLKLKMYKRLIERTTPRHLIYYIIIILAALIFVNILSYWFIKEADAQGLLTSANGNIFLQPTMAFFLTLFLILILGILLDVLIHVAKKEGFKEGFERGRLSTSSSKVS